MEEVFATVHRIAPGKRGAFQARLRHLQRLGVPPGTNTGKGVAAAYGPQQVAILAVALELLQLGLSPEHAATVLEKNGGRILRQVCHAASDLPMEREYSGAQQLVLIDPGGLSTLQSPEAVPEPYLGGGPANQFDDFISHAPEEFRGHLAAIDLRWLMHAVAYSAQDLGFGEARKIGWDLSVMLQD